MHRYHKKTKERRDKWQISIKRPAGPLIPTRIKELLGFLPDQSNAEVFQEIFMKNEKESNEEILVEQLRQEFDQRMRVAEEKWRREMERWRADWESKLEGYKADRALHQEMMKVTCAAGQGALKATVIINGGASVALLAFIGNTWKNNNGDSIAGLAFALLFYVIAVLCGAVAAGTTYLSQFAWGYEKAKTALIVNLFTVLIGVGSYVLFALGTWHAYHVFIGK